MSAEPFLEHLSRAITFDTVTQEDPSVRDSSPLVRFREFLAATYPRCWASLAPEVVADHALLLTWSGTEAGGAPIVLMAHQDVVPVDPVTLEAWSQAPFAGARTATHLVGRGAIDDKASLIAILEAVEGLLADGFQPRCTVVLAFGHDEESPGGVGAATIAQLLVERGVRAQLVLDEGGFVTEGVVPLTHRPVALLGIAEKGYLDVEITAAGEPGHSSQPPRHTAVGLVARAIARLEEAPLPARLDLVTDFLRASAAAASPSGRLGLRLLPRLGPLSRRILGRRPETNASIRTTTAATIVEGGVKANVLPSAARAIVNFRLIPGDTVASVMKHVRRTVGKGIAARVVRSSEPSPVSDVSSDGFRLVSDTVAEIFPTAVVAPWVVIGATDSRHFTSVSDTILRFIPFEAGPSELTGFHGIDERIRLAGADRAVRFYRRLIEGASERAGR